MRSVIVQNTASILLGRVGENNTTQVIWENIVSEYRENFGDGSFTLAVKRCGDKSPYFVDITADEANISWLVSGGDVAKAGMGSCELTYTVDGAIAKTQTRSTVVYNSLSADEPTDPPSPVENWVQKVIDASNRAKQSEQSASESAAQAAQDAEATRQNVASSLQNAESALQNAERAEQSASSAEEASKSAQEAVRRIPMPTSADEGNSLFVGEDDKLVYQDGRGNWQQNDQNSIDYIKNRPGGYDVYSSELAATGSFASAGSDLPIAAVDFPVKFIVDGQKVTVKIDNETFERTVHRVPDDKKLNEDDLAEYQIREADGEGIQIGDNGWVFIFQLNSAGTWGKATVATGTYLGKTFEVYAEVATPVQFPAKYVNNKFIVTATAGSDGTTCTADHTVAEVLAAYNAGMIVECHVIVGQFTAILPLVWPSESTKVDDTTFDIVGFGAMVSADKLEIGIDINSVSVFGFNTGSEEAWAMVPSLFCDQDAMQTYVGQQINEVRQLPFYNSDDNGKFLRVVNGNPVWQTVPNAEGANF